MQQDVRVVIAISKKFFPWSSRSAAIAISSLRVALALCLVAAAAFPLAFKRFSLSLFPAIHLCMSKVFSPYRRKCGVAARVLGRLWVPPVAAGAGVARDASIANSSAVVNALANGVACHGVLARRRTALTLSKNSARSAQVLPCSDRSSNESSWSSKSTCESTNRKHCVAVAAWNSSDAMSDLEEAIEKAEAERERQQAVLGELTARFPAPIDGLQRVQDLASAVEELEQRITQEENAIQDMDARLLAVRPEASQENHAAEVGQLWAELETAKSAESQVKVLQASMDAAEEKRSHDKAALESASAAVTELREICGAANMGALETTLAGIERKSEFRKAIAKSESNLASMSGGQALERFIEEATGSSEDELQGEKAELERVLPEHQGARDSAREQLNLLKVEDAQLQQASDAAAVQQQQAELHLSSIVSDVRRFMELQHAIQFLREQIEIYRERTQGPMIESTSTYFAALTNGGFAKVAAQMTEKNVPKLVGVREDGSFIETTAMSEGTADQLYLALRFAAIDLHLSTYSPMPLVLDDLLMTFDDERTTALLPILANLSQKTQILVFTHHQHLLDLFERNLPGQFVSHRL